MTRKYFHRSFREFASGSHGRFEGGPRRRKPLDPKQRLLAIYVGLLGAVMVLFLFHVVDPFRARREATLVHGEGTISRKTVNNEGAPDAVYHVEIVVHTDDGHALSDMVPVDVESWERASEGEKVYVDYYINRQGDAIRIMEIQGGNAGNVESKTN